VEPLTGHEIWNPWEPGFLSLIIYTLFVCVLVGLLLFVSAWLGKKKPDPEKLKPWECGITPTGSARTRYTIPFYLVAAFFLIFDVEAVFILSWAIAADPLGWDGWLQITFFIVILLISLFYVWGKGGLEWGPTAPKSLNKAKT
jgi:NADH-quinone oxidoreductase subunit A